VGKMSPGYAVVLNQFQSRENSMGNARQGSAGNGASAKRRPLTNGQPTGTPEHQRLREANDQGVAWRKWGAYLSERQWGSVREDVSNSGDAWNSFPHDHARSRVYLWGEDGIAGFCDDTMRICFALAFWNGRDPILKE